MSRKDQHLKKNKKQKKINFNFLPFESNQAYIFSWMVSNATQISPLPNYRFFPKIALLLAFLSKKFDFSAYLKRMENRFDYYLHFSLTMDKVKFSLLCLVVLSLLGSSTCWTDALPRMKKGIFSNYFTKSPYCKESLKFQTKYYSL